MAPRYAQSTKRDAGTPGVDTPARLTQVLIVDHSELVRVGMKAVLSDLPSLDVVGAVATAEEALRAARELQPRVVLVDAELPDEGTYKVVRAIRQSGGPVSVVVISSAPEAQRALIAFESGASGYLSKDVTRDALFDAIRRAASGEVSVDPVLGAHLLQALAASGSTVMPGPDALTARELDVLRLLASGRTNKEIASQLIVALGTVKVHVERILSKLGSTNRSEAAVRAIELGLVKPAEGLPSGQARTNH
jgi:DNA-binding NarL/FixJ family response regulator